MAEAENMNPVETDTPKKRKINGSAKDLMKKIRVSSHTTGTDCKCKRFKCFEAVNEEERQRLIDCFNAFATKNQQDAYLSTLVRILSVKRRRPRQDEANARLHEHSFGYIVRVFRGELAEEVQVCLPGFCALFGMTKTRVGSIRRALIETGRPPIDGRGKHTNRPHKLTDETRKAVCDHISFFSGRISHYTISHNQRPYQPEELSISKLHAMFKDTYPDLKVGYETYRTIFNSQFDPGFGCPQKDTSSKFDESVVKQECIDTDLMETSPENDQAEHHKISLEHELHKRMEPTIYDKKAAWTQRANGSDNFGTIAFDFRKNLRRPNKTTNDVYYRQQLTYNLFFYPLHNVIYFINS